MANEPKLPPVDPEPVDPLDPIPGPNPDEPGPDVLPRIDPPFAPVPERMRAVLVAAFLGVALLYGQAPSADPHEDPVVQNAPEGQKPGAAQTSPTPEASVPRTEVKAKSAKTVVPAPKTREVAALDAQAVMLGTWILAKEKSSYKPGPAPLSETRTYRKTPSGIEASIVTTLIDGTVQTRTFPWMVDSNEYPINAAEVLDNIELKQIDNLTSEASLRHGTKELATARRSIDASGKTMTITVTDMTSEERPVTVTAVYEKQ